MAKVLTTRQLKRAIRRAPEEVEKEGNIFLQRGLAEYKKVAVQGKPWRIGESGGAIPRDTGNLRERHRTEVRNLEGSFGVDPNTVKYAGYVHRGTYKMEARPWLDYARQRADNRVQKHYRVFMDNILEFIAQ